MIFDQFNLAGKVAVVVGGTGGIGEALSLGLAEAGADVVSTSRNSAKVADISNKIKALGRNTFEIQTDATSEKDIRTLSEKSLEFYGKIDILVNGAGVNIRKNVVQMTYNDWATVLKTNLDSVFLSSKYFSKNMIERKYGKILNIGSLTSVVAMSNSCAYAASKGGVVQLTKALAVELSKYNINVNAVLPGYFSTEMTEPIMQNSVAYNRIIERTPMNRIGTVDELIGTAIFLTSDASKFITGETLAVDGGFLSFGVDLALK
ncbi:MAG: SDR family oxidoreductase [Desulfobulbaceae bacterium]|nr:SDR family oxidoreductase [Desulfobulbaceae bacterium]